MIKGIIYDMDGLMINSEPIQEKAWEKPLEKYGHKLNELPEAMRAHFMGMRVIDITKEIVDYFRLDVEPQALHEDRMIVFLDLASKGLIAMPGLLESLSLFKNHQYKIALASSGTKNYIDLVLEKFNIAGYFDAVISGDDVSKGKPDPEPYLIASGKLGLEPAECLVLEDADNGIISAKIAGCRCFAITNPNTPQQDYSQADKILSSLNEITLEMIKNL